MTSPPPLAVDIDGTLTRSDGAVDPRIWSAFREWEAPVVIATGKAFPYPIALCHFMGIEEDVIAENGGIVAADGRLTVNGDPEAARAVADAFIDAGHDLGWGELDLINRWRETEVAVSRDAPLEPLRELAAEHGLEVVDTGYAYHVKDPEITKGLGLETVAESLGYDPAEFVAIGDSANDVSMFERVGRSFAVANADDAARGAADAVAGGAFSDGTLAVLKELRA